MPNGDALFFLSTRVQCKQSLMENKFHLFSSLQSALNLRSDLFSWRNVVNFDFEKASNWKGNVKIWGLRSNCRLKYKRRFKNKNKSKNTFFGILPRFFSRVIYFTIAISYLTYSLSSIHVHVTFKRLRQLFLLLLFVISLYRIQFVRRTEADISLVRFFSPFNLSVSLPDMFCTLQSTIKSAVADDFSIQCSMLFTWLDRCARHECMLLQKCWFNKLKFTHSVGAWHRHCVGR